MTPKEANSRLKKWHIEKFGTDVTNPHRTMVKLTEEVGELAKGILREDVPNILEECADIFNTMSHIVRFYGGDLMDEVEKKIGVIEKRLKTGKKT